MFAKITITLLLLLPHQTTGCLGGFGGGGQQCCPPHAAPTCASSCGSAISAPQYAAPQPQSYNPPPIVYPAPQPLTAPQPLPPAVGSSYGGAYHSPPYQNSYQQGPPQSNNYIQPSANAQGYPSQGQQIIPQKQNYIGQPQGQPHNNYVGGQQLPQGPPAQREHYVHPGAAPPAHIPPTGNTGRPSSYNNRNNVHVKESSENAAIHEPFSGIDEEDGYNKNQKQVEGSKKEKETNSGPVDEEDKHTDSGNKNTVESATEEHTKEDAHAQSYGEEEHSTGYKFT